MRNRQLPLDLGEPPTFPPPLLWDVLPAENQLAAVARPGPADRPGRRVCRS